jgi:hypothetical protein
MYNPSHFFKLQCQRKKANNQPSTVTMMAPQKIDTPTTTKVLRQQTTNIQHEK